MLNVQLGTRQRKRGRTHLPALLIHVLETQPAAGSTSSVRALGAEEAVPATLCHPTRYLSAPPTPRCGCAELLLPRAEGVVLVRSSQDCLCAKGTWMFPLPASRRSKLAQGACQPHAHHFPHIFLLVRDGESCSPEIKGLQPK